MANLTDEQRRAFILSVMFVGHMRQNITLKAEDLMSKGIGARQRMLLAAIQQHGCLSTFEACSLAHRVEITVRRGERRRWLNDAQLIGSRRALAGLARRGLIIGPRRGFHDRQARWCTAEYATEFAAAEERSAEELRLLRHQCRCS
jgi:hypothetical protein